LALLREESEIHAVNLAVSAVLFVAGALLSWILGTLIARPARRLTEVVGEIVRTRDLTREIPRLSNDEIGDLGTAFGAMVQMQRTTLATIRALARALTGLGSKLDQAGQNVLSGAKAISERVSESGNAARELLGSLGDVGRLTNDLEVRVQESSGTVKEERTQVESSNRVLSGVDVIRAVTKSQEEVVQALDEAIRALRAQANGLEKEVEPFRV